MRKGWPEITLDEVCQFKGGNGFKEHLQGKETGLHPFIKVSDLTLEGNEKYITRSNNWIDESDIKEMGVNLMPSNSVVFAKVGAALKLNKRRILTIPTAIDNNMMAAIPNTQKIDPEYLYYFMLTQDLGRFCQESAVPSINQQHMAEILIPLPSIEEQRRIVSILRTWDDAIEKARKLVKVKELKKEALVQRLLTGKIRISGAETSWKTLKLRDVTTEIKTRNQDGKLGLDRVMGVNKVHGLIPMREETIGVSLDRYKAVPPQAFAYNPMRINIGSLAMSGKTETVLVSPDYVVFSCNEGGLDPNYFNQFRRSHIWDKYMEMAGNGSVRIRIYYNDLADMKICLPSIQDQKIIAEILCTCDAELIKLKEQLEAYKTQKRGLMQKLLTGQWRVKTSNTKAA